MKQIIRTFLLILIAISLLSCVSKTPAVESTAWARSTLKTLTLREKIGQMMVYSMRLDYYDADSPKWQEIDRILDTDGIGSLHVWGGDVLSAYAFVNEMQTRSKVPMFVQADLEYGIKARFKRGSEIPWPMAQGATGNPDLAYAAGKITAEEGRAIGINLALTPTVDVNNNPQNPIINTRAYGEDPDHVIAYATRFMDGLHDGGMLSTAKHFPGHGDTYSDSHTELARIPDDPERLWEIELRPFQALIDAGVDMVMIGHLDAGKFQMEPGVPSSLSPFWLQDILRDQMGFKGVIITDAMAMGGITRGYSDRYALIQTIKAGSDLIIQNYNYTASIDYVEAAVRDGQISESRIDESVLRILTLKSKLGLDKKKTLDLDRIQSVVGSESNLELADLIMQSALTLVKEGEQSFFPIRKSADESLYVIDIRDREKDRRITEVTAGLMDQFELLENFTIDNSLSEDEYSGILDKIPDSALVLVNVISQVKMNKNRVFLIQEQIDFIHALQEKTERLLVVGLGTPFLIQSFPDIPGYLCTYSNQIGMQRAVVQGLMGQISITGSLPVNIPGVAEIGHGINKIADPLPMKVIEPPTWKRREIERNELLFHVAPEEVGSDPGKIMPHLQRALEEQAWPGGVLLAARNGKIFLHEYFGSHTYEDDRHTYRGDIFDLASVTKVIATTSAAMKLYEEGKLNLDTTVVSYLPEFTGPDSANTEMKKTVTVRHLLTHTAGLKPFKRFYRMEAPDVESLLDSVFQSELDTVPGTNYAYSDIGLITLGKLIEAIAGTDLNTFTDSLIFKPLAMSQTGFLPENDLDWIVPTEYSDLDSGLVHGYVHDENSHSLGGITGHAGLFSNAIDLARFAQMMLNKGTLGDTTIFQPATIDTFTSRANIIEDNSRCLGWDSPHNGSSGGVYLSPNSFGHTGFTGTSIWIDPDNQMFVILLTNAVHPLRKYKYPNYFDWRQRIHSSVYESLGFTEPTDSLEWRNRWVKEARRKNSWWYKLLNKFR